MNKPRDNQGRFITSKKEGEQDKGKCPECGKKLVLNDIRLTHFCNMICETNYRYRQKHKDPLTGKLPTSERVKKW